MMYIRFLYDIYVLRNIPKMNENSLYHPRGASPESPLPPDVGAVLDGIFDQRVAFQLVRPSGAPLGSQRLRSLALRQVEDV